MFDLKSMTGYAAQNYALSCGQLNIQIRAVNSRFLELQIATDPILQPLELELQNMLKKQVHRGNVNISLSITGSMQSNLHLDQNYLSKLNEILTQVKQTIPHGHIDLIQVLNYPGVLRTTANILSESDRQLVLDSFKDCVARFDQSRREEGSNLRKVLLTKVQDFSQYLDKIAQQLDNLVALERARLQTKLKNFALELDHNRLEQEVALLAQKGDIAEEYDRMLSHLQSLNNILASPQETNGKRLDFITQELLRESNTTAAKASTLDISHIAIELKVLCEQLREQVQNIE